MSLAEETRAAVRRRPFLVDALRVGVLNYTAAARFLADKLDRDADLDAIATALRRFSESLGEYETEDRRASVSMKSGLGEIEVGEGEKSASSDALFSIGGTAFAPGEGSLTGILASGEVDATTLASTLSRLAAAEIEVLAAGVAGDSMLVVVERRDGPDAVRLVEDSLDIVPCN